MRPSEIRQRMIRDHDALRWLCVRVEFAANRVLAGDEASEEALDVAGAELYRLLLDHLEHEERVLLPVLGDVDAWGPERVARVEAEHREQRRRLAEVFRPLEPLTPHHRAAVVLREIAELREDMQAEERDTLSPDLLRDDVVSIDHVGA